MSSTGAGRRVRRRCVVAYGDEHQPVRRRRASDPAPIEARKDLAHARRRALPTARSRPASRRCSAPCASGTRSPRSGRAGIRPCARPRSRVPGAPSTPPDRRPPPGTPRSRARRRGRPPPSASRPNRAAARDATHGDARTPTASVRSGCGTRSAGSCACRRGSNASSTTVISRMATSSGVSALRLQARRRRSLGTRDTGTATTCPVACTPASVRPARADAHRLAQRRRERLLEDALDRRAVRLELPAVEMRAVVLDEQLQLQGVRPPKSASSNHFQNTSTSTKPISRSHAH